MQETLPRFARVLHGTLRLVKASLSIQMILPEIVILSGAGISVVVASLRALHRLCMAYVDSFSQSALPPEGLTEAEKLAKSQSDVQSEQSEAMTHKSQQLTFAHHLLVQVFPSCFHWGRGWGEAL